MTNELHLIPEAIKGIAARADKNNKFTNSNEKFMAISQLEAIIRFCEKAIKAAKS